MTGASPCGGDVRDDAACASAEPVVSPRRSVTTADRTSLSFTETMTGYARPVGTPGDPQTRAEDRGGRTDHRVRGVRREREGGPAARERLTFRLTITADDVDRFLDDREHLARAEGWIDAESFGGRRPILRGWFNLFAPAKSPGGREMRYRLHFTDAQGQPRTLAGWKDIHPGPLTAIWPQTTTLFFELLEGHVLEGIDDAGSAVIAEGRLRIRPTAFARQLTTFRTSGPHGVSALLRFGRFFLGQLWDVYGPARTRRRRAQEHV
jgi:cholesterol oxidase